MPTTTYTPLAAITLTGSDSEIVFSNIPGTYRDLILVANFQNSGLSSAGRLRLNGDTGASYNGVWFVGNNTNTASVGAEASANGARVFGASNGPDNSMSNIAVMHFLDYSETNKQKQIITRYGSVNTDTQNTSTRWASTAAITSITLYDVLGQTYQTGSTFSLWGVIA